MIFEEEIILRWSSRETERVRLVEDVVRRLDLSRFPMSLRLRVEDTRLRIDMKVNERDRPELQTIVSFHQPIPPIVHTPKDAEEWVHYVVLHRAIKHELDECWLIDGVRVRDPHVSKSGLPL